MERREVTCVNEFVIQGMIVRKFVNEAAANITIKSPRNNMPIITKEGECSYNYPEIAFYGNMKDAADLYEDGNVVRITGMIQTQKRMTVQKRGFYDQKLVGLSVEPAPKLLMREFGVSGAFDHGNKYIGLENLVKLEGIISKMAVPSQGILILNIRTLVDGKINNIQAFIYDQNIKSYLEEYRIGDYVCAAGTIQTVKKGKSDGTDRYFRNIVLYAVCKR